MKQMRVKNNICKSLKLFVTLERNPKILLLIPSYFGKQSLVSDTENCFVRFLKSKVNKRSLEQSIRDKCQVLTTKKNCSIGVWLFVDWCWWSTLYHTSSHLSIHISMYHPYIGPLMIWSWIKFSFAALVIDMLNMVFIWKDVLKVVILNWHQSCVGI